MDLSNWVIVIPARLASERLPQKPLADLAGKPLIVRVYENLKPLRASGAEVIVAIDSHLTAKTCEQYGVPHRMTSTAHISGTDRCAEAAAAFSDRQFVLNVQGDEPFLDCDDLRRLMTTMAVEKTRMSTLGFLASDILEYGDPNIVKIAVNDRQEAIYFSRASIPFDRDAARTGLKTRNHIQHIGVYAFTQESLREFCSLAPSSLEQIEKLEQLRAINAGWKIRIVQANKKSIGIDTPKDLENAQKVFHG